MSAADMLSGQWVLATNSGQSSLCKLCATDVHSFTGQQLSRAKGRDGYETPVPIHGTLHNGIVEWKTMGPTNPMLGSWKYSYTQVFNIRAIDENTFEFSEKMTHGSIRRGTGKMGSDVSCEKVVDIWDGESQAVVGTFKFQMVDSDRILSHFKAYGEDSWAEAAEVWSQRCWTGNLHESIVFIGHLDECCKIISEGEVWDMAQKTLLDNFTACRRACANQAHAAASAGADLPEILLLSGQPISSQPSTDDSALTMRILVADELSVPLECISLVSESGHICDMTQMHEVGSTQLHAVVLPDCETRIRSFVQECLASLNRANVSAKVASLASLGIRTPEELGYVAKGFLDIAVQEFYGHKLLAICVDELCSQLQVPSTLPNGRSTTFRHALISMCQKAYQEDWYPLLAIMRVTALLFAYGFLPKRAAQLALNDILEHSVHCVCEFLPSQALPKEHSVHCVCEFLTTAKAISQDISVELQLSLGGRIKTADRVADRVAFDLNMLRQEYHIRLKEAWLSSPEQGLPMYSEHLGVKIESLVM